MRARPPGLDDDEVISGLEQGWDLDVDALAYVAKGGGSYHWTADVRDGTRYFVTVDELDAKPWFGSDRESTFDGLRTAFDLALTLRENEGHDFVLAPLRSGDGESLRRVSPRYSVALFPYVDGRVGDFNVALVGADRAQVLDLLAELHRSPTNALPPAMDRGRALPGRAALEAALRDVGRVWDAGPMAEATRALVIEHAGELREWLATFDRLTAEIAQHDCPLVVTHGEPHPGNLMWSGADVFLIDWDTVGLAVPERDLWLLDDGTADGFARYTKSSGRAVDPTAIALYRLTWTLADLASYIPYLRTADDTNADTDKAWAAINTYLT